jgi:hypothetical protein
MDKSSTINGVPNMFGKENGSPKPENTAVLRPVCTATSFAAFLMCQNQSETSGNWKILLQICLKDK